MNINDYSMSSGTSVYQSSIIGYSGTTTATSNQYQNINGNLHGAFVTDSYTNGNITIPYEIIKLMAEEIKKLPNMEREIFNNHELINKLVKEKKIKITIKIPEEEMI